MEFNSVSSTDSAQISGQGISVLDENLEQLKTSDLHVVETCPLLAPVEVKTELPITPAIAKVVSNARARIRNILNGSDRRLLVVVGPCSIHDVKAAREYAEKLAKFRDGVSDALEIVMRVYFEKPRTTVGWKGLINDPHLNGTFDINYGIRMARGLLLDVAKLGLPSATELLDPIVPQYLADLISWTAIGARTTESQTHREMSSGLSMPVGFKNGTDGSIDVAINALLSARQPHRFLGVNNEGMASIVTTTGNPDGHIVLRGGKQGPNYDNVHVEAIANRLRDRKLLPYMMVDCSHDNSGQDYKNQPIVLQDIAEQVRNGSEHIVGIMLESHLNRGKQPLKELSKLEYGKSITDGCINFETTVETLTDLANAVRSGRF
ncbi:3-deoxy-7-phosphoheptulonate synthase [Pseudanabaena sp. SR411]|uniref:3-deoxy-7-phosphoheptulonate synthase n=1 Tax=Pseudanabaena sp. SR411 TaxID=1980935 RepID=UPI000B98CF1A|nr:3-deoxy-7-phosphoheptulonate synthase [Pseudanabaena sp. SR411]OYQ68217.1 3-deoxy-7-phosphoheptulonate synthase [Pseudanabaena sp. SR411]